MTPMHIITDPNLVDEKLEAEGMLEGSCPIEALLLQHSGTHTGNAAAMLIVVLPDGRKVLAKTTLRLLELGVAACRAAAGAHIGQGHRGPVQ